MNDNHNNNPTEAKKPAVDGTALLGVRAVPLEWREETANTQEGILINYFAEVFCGEYCVSPYEHDIWMVTGVISGIKSDRFFGSIADCQIWASKNWERHILSSVEKA